MVNRRKISRRKKRAAGSFLKQFLVGFLLCLFLVLVGGVVWYGSRLESFTIVSIEVEGGETIDHSFVKEKVDAVLQGEYYNLVPRRFAFTYPEKEIFDEVMKIEKVKSVFVSRSNGKTVKVVVYEYDPAVMWCDREQELDGCVFVDEKGYAFTKAPPISGNAMLRIDNGAKPEIGQQPFTSRLVTNANDFSRSLRQEFNFITTSTVLVGPEELIFNIAGGGEVKITLRQPIETSIDNLEVLLNSDEFQDLKPGSFGYIDLRFGDKVFVNENSGEPDTEVTASSTEEVSE